MSQATLKYLEDLKQKVIDQQRVVEMAREEKKNDEEIEREVNMLHSLQRRLHQLENEARMGH